MNTREQILDMKEQRANLVTQMRSLMDEHEGEGMPPEAEETMRSMESDFDKLNEKLNREERQLERERMMGEMNEEPLKRDAMDPDEETRMAFRNYLVSGSEEAFEEYRALSQASPTQAGYLVAPEKFVADLIKDVDNAFPLRGLAKRFTLKNAQSLGFPKRTARMTNAAWGTEISTPAADSALAFGKKELKPSPLTAEILVSKTLIRNSSIPVDQIIRAELAYAFSEPMENAYMTGNGVGQPLGIFTASDDGISTSRDVSTGNTTTSIKFDGLKEAKYSLKQAHARKAQWMFHRDAIKQLAKLKDGEGQYIWEQSVKVDESDILLGRSVIMSEYAPNTFTTGLYVGAFGDYQHYYIADSLDMELQVLMELYARSNQVDYIGRLETDGMPVLEEAFARVKLA